MYLCIIIGVGGGGVVIFVPIESVDAVILLLRKFFYIKVVVVIVWVTLKQQGALSHVLSEVSLLILGWYCISCKPATLGFDLLFFV